jgi:CRISPR-associated protein Cas1
MKLVLNTPGVKLSKTGECFLIRNKDEKDEISAKKVQQILITTHVSLTSDAIELALENNIDVVFLKWNGSPLGRVWHSKLGSIATIRRKQLLLQDTEQGLMLVKEWISEKIYNQIGLLRKLSMNRRDERKNLIKNAIEKLTNSVNKIENLDSRESINTVRSTMLGIEGMSSNPKSA